MHERVELSTEQITSFVDDGFVVVPEAQLHRGTRPRFMAQPPLLPGAPLELDRGDGRYFPVEQAIRQAPGEVERPIR